MGYRGKLVEKERARELRGEGFTMLEIATRLGVSKSSVSLWTRDVEFVPRERESGRFGARNRGPNVRQRRRAEEIERLLVEGRERIGELTEKEFLVAGAALYAGEGSKGDRDLKFANSDPHMIAFFCAWLRRFFDVDEQRLRVRLYLHQV
jgi:transcriptional regulator with XRE-family HTH domain